MLVARDFSELLPIVDKGFPVFQYDDFGFTFGLSTASIDEEEEVVLAEGPPTTAAFAAFRFFE